MFEAARRLGLPVKLHADQLSDHGAAAPAADRGTLAPGKRADFALWDVAQPAELAYWLGGNPCAGVVRGGKAVAKGKDLKPDSYNRAQKS